MTSSAPFCSTGAFLSGAYRAGRLRWSRLLQATRVVPLQKYLLAILSAMRVASAWVVRVGFGPPTALEWALLSAINRTSDLERLTGSVGHVTHPHGALQVDEGGSGPIASNNLPGGGFPQNVGSNHGQALAPFLLLWV